MESLREIRSTGEGTRPMVTPLAQRVPGGRAVIKRRRREEVDRHAPNGFADPPLANGPWILHLCSLAEACVSSATRSAQRRSTTFLSPYADRMRSPSRPCPTARLPYASASSPALLTADEADKHSEFAMERCERLGAWRHHRSESSTRVPQCPAREQRGFRSRDGPTLRCRVDLQRSSI